MKKITFCKLKREAKRAMRQLIDLPASTWEYLFFRPIYDHIVSNRIVVHYGSKEVSGEIAIYLVFSPNKLQKSHFDMVTQLLENDITPIVVSNHPLSLEDRVAILSKSALLIERPNVGYDFGGYRDAVLRLAPYLQMLERLYILNDSVWMVESSESWFTQVRAAGHDFAGATSHFGIDQPNVENFRDLKWNYTSDREKFHYASYALAVGPEILRDPQFIAFWRGLRISSNKHRTVRRGEIGLTKWVKARGYNHGATFDVTKLSTELESMEGSVLEDLARHLVIPNDADLAQQCAIALKSDPMTETGRRDRIQIILMAVARQAICYVMPYFNLRYRNFQFVKKSPLRLSRCGAEITLDALSELDGPLGRCAHFEAQAMIAQRTDG
ncbi:rhamnan synthesis F family protein [Thioclava nitratireducens]|uniref:rhamnan synthesis F family protein n=1 Tax=Thioclava nitratireducens TaxID=1915078 RepID=UPI0024812C8D|nr:rhamnan synthesis F family protein [Thioclava nitratireducens]WGT51290.1 rhamnan synthesis F family protein [Thioclava nitratireducens]